MQTVPYFLTIWIILPSVVCDFCMTFTEMEEADDSVVISFKNMSLDSVPANIPANVTHLDLSFNDISSLSVDGLRFSHLRSLSFASNNFNTLQDGVFSELPSLQCIDLSANSLQEIQPGAFRGLQSLQIARFRQNHLVSWDFNVLRDSAIRLTLLDLSKNRIESLKSSNGSFPLMEYFNLSGNRLHALTLGLFHGLDGLLALDLSDNNISYIEEHSFVNLTSLETLDFSFNKLSSLNEETCGGFMKLKSLNIGFNALQRLPQTCLSFLEKLEVLFISGNNFTDLPATSFANNSGIRSLEISHCGLLKSISPLAFNSLKNLTELQITFNPLLANLDQINFSNLKKITNLSLDSNKLLKTLPEIHFTKSDSLRKFSLRNLDLQCDCDLKWVKEEIKWSASVHVDLTNSTCLYHPSKTRPLLTEVSVDEMVCDVPIVISSSLSTEPPFTASFQVTFSNIGRPVIYWSLPNGLTLETEQGRMNFTIDNTTFVDTSNVIVSSVIVCTLNISSIDEDMYGVYTSTASNMAGNTSHAFEVNSESFGLPAGQLASVQLSVALSVVLAALFLVAMVCFLNINHKNVKPETKQLLENGDDDAKQESINGQRKRTSYATDNSSIPSTSTGTGLSIEIEYPDTVNESHENKAFQSDEPGLSTRL